MKSGLILFFIVFLAACTTPPRNGVAQVATIDALLAGIYDGDTTLAEIGKYGDIGLGTFNRLDGEMLLLDGVFYQINVQGTVKKMPGTTKTPFAVVSDFNPNLFAKIDQPVDLEGLKSFLDSLVPNQNLFAVIRIEGDFPRIRTRSVPAQSPPYRPLAEVVKEQKVFDLEKVSGTLVGFRCPPFVKGLNVTGYHFHFLTHDKQAGGHVLSLDLRRGQVQIDSSHDSFDVLLPGLTHRFHKTDLSIDRQYELETVEQE